MDNVYADSSSALAHKKVLDGFVSKSIQCKTVDGIYNGSGTEILRKGNVEYSLVCDWENGRKNGPGVISNESGIMGDSRHFLMGFFVNDELEGRVRIFHESNQKVKMEGRAVNGMWSGNIVHFDEEGNEVENGEVNICMDYESNSKENTVIVNIMRTDDTSSSSAAASSSLTTPLIGKSIPPTTNGQQYTVRTLHPPQQSSSSSFSSTTPSRLFSHDGESQTMPRESTIGHFLFTTRTQTQTGETSSHFYIRPPPPLSSIPEVVKYWKGVTPIFYNSFVSLFLVVFCCYVSWMYKLSTLIPSVCILFIHLLMLLVFIKPRLLKPLFFYIYALLGLESVLCCTIGLMMMSGPGDYLEIQMCCNIFGMIFFVVALLCCLLVRTNLKDIDIPENQMQYVNNHPAVKWCYCQHCISFGGSVGSAFQ